jgi:hypothetical protein
VAPVSRSVFSFTWLSTVYLLSSTWGVPEQQQHQQNAAAVCELLSLSVAIQHVLALPVGL